jgi:PAS domain S-box-containing protein
LKSDIRHRESPDLKRTVAELRQQLAEANDILEAIRTGQIDALMVKADDGRQLYTLKSADHVYRLFVEKMTEGAITLNREGIIVFSNTRFAGMTDSLLSDVLGVPFDDFIAPESKAAFRECFQRAWGEDCKIEAVLRAKNSSKPVQLGFNILELDGETSLGIILTDLTAQKRQQHALETSNSDLQQFASVASHDLQEPLRKIQLFTDLIKNQNPGLPSSVKNFVDKIIGSTNRMRALIVDILNYSTLSADTQSEGIDLKAIFKDLLEDFELVIEDKQATITIGDMPVLQGNRGQIRQVFHNIVSNALKFSRPDLPLVIGVEAKRISERSFTSPEEPDGPFCMISIRDNGIGFDEKYLPQVFALFERLHSKDKYEGTGIGLAIAKKIIDKHAGLITAVSDEGRGSEFRIILPMRRI